LATEMPFIVSGAHWAKGLFGFFDDENQAK
jgi:hypothetical protein